MIEALNNVLKIFEEKMKRIPFQELMLAKLMLKYWYEKVINDITQMNLHVEGRGFNISSEALNLREKKNI